MDVKNSFLDCKEYAAAGAYEEPHRSLFYRKSLAIRRFYERCELPAYQGKPLYPSGVMQTKMRIYPHYLNGLKIAEHEFKDDYALAEQYKQDFCKYASSVPIEHTVAGNMWTHGMPNYERILKEGFLSYVARIEKIEDLDMKEGLLHLIKGIERYAERCVEYLILVKAEPRLINALKRVPMYPAEDIYQAVVGWNFILYLDSCDDIGCLATGLLPYYKGEDIRDLLANLYDNLDENDGYSMSLPGDYNPLTLQCLDASKGKRRPMIELLVDEDTPDCVWEKAFEVMKTMNGQPAFYNKKVIYNALRERFPNITDEDVKRFCGGGCTETMLAGYSCVGSLDAGINLLLVLEKVLYEKLAVSNSFEEFYDTYIKEVTLVVDTVTTEISNSQINRANYNPVPMRTLLVDDCIENAKEYYNGGARYKWSIVSFAGLVNAIDSLLVVRDFVFKKKWYAAEQFLEKLRNNDEAFLKIAREYEVSHGKDNDSANAFAKKFSSEIFSLLDNKKPAIGDGFLAASILFNNQVSAGEKIGATPDGRTAYSPIADSIAAIFQKDTEGPLALLRSVTSLDLAHAIGTPVFNFNVQPDYDFEVFKSLVKGYISQGGIQMQCTCISKQMLLDAYKNPALYKNLVVRVAGYSEYFYRLRDELKRAIIARTIQE